MPKRMPTLYLPHGGGPCFFMDWRLGPPDTWDKTAAWLKGIPAALPVKPRALLVVSAHWEEARFTVTGGADNTLLYDYSGFPPHTYELKWPAPVAPALSQRVVALLTEAGMDAGVDTARGLDHGVFVPMLLSWPLADIPTVQLSLRRGLDPAEHLALGRALAPLRDEGVFLVGSGMSYHNMRGFGRARADSEAFDTWLNQAVTQPAASRDAALQQWASGPKARACHPREEHLLPLMVCAGAAGQDPGSVAFQDHVMSVAVSAHSFGEWSTTT
jgi:aromatic ring-opening dioxygenase catalytic subunit (LigB family)